MKTLNSYLIKNTFRFRQLFIGNTINSTNIGVRGVGGGTVATGIGTVQFTILNTNNVIEHITLNNIIYLPYCTKNYCQYVVGAKI